MSFLVYVPCDCSRKGLIKLPPFKENLVFEGGIWEITPDLQLDADFENIYDNWKFCEHEQIAIEYSMSQGVISIKAFLKEKYPLEFSEVKKFLPIHNDWVNSDYEKDITLKELHDLKIKEPTYEKRLNQFIALLETAIQTKNEIYWV